MSDNKEVKIQRQASNLGSIKGLPKGSGHGGYMMDPESKHTTADEMRRLLSTGKTIHLKSGRDDYILKSFLAGDKLEGGFICPIKLKQASDTDSLNDIISSTDTLDVDSCRVENTFDDEEDAFNYFLMNTEKIEFESTSNFDKTLNEFYNQIIR